MALEQVAAILEIGERFAPAWRLKALVMEDIGLPNTAVQILEGARSRCGELPGLLKASTSSSRLPAVTLRPSSAPELDQGQDLGPTITTASPTPCLRGHADQAVQMLDGVSALRPELWYHALEAGRLTRAASSSGAFTGPRSSDPEACRWWSCRRGVRPPGQGRGGPRQLARALKLSPSDELLERRLDALSAGSGAARPRAGEDPRDADPEEVGPRALSPRPDRGAAHWAGEPSTASRGALLDAEGYDSSQSGLWPTCLVDTASRSTPRGCRRSTAKLACTGRSRSL